MHMSDEFGSSQKTVDFSHKQNKSSFRFISKLIISNSYVSDWAMSCSFFRTYASILAERERQGQLNYIVMHPYSHCRFVWESFMIFVYFAAFFFIPFEACNILYSQLNPKVFVNYGFPLFVLHTVFIIDMIFNFYTGYMDHGRKTIVLDKNSIANKYYKTYFWFDILATVPAVFNAIRLYIIKHEHNEFYNKVTIMNLLKIVRIPTFLHYLTKIVNRYHWDGLAYRLSIMCLLSIFFFHWASCLHFIIPFAIKLKPITVFSADTWIHSTKANLGNVSAGQFYLTSLFNVVNLMLGCTCKRRPQHWLELVTGVFYNILGTLYMSFLYIELLNLIRERMEPETKYDEFMTQLRDYMRHNQLPSNIQQRMDTFFEYRYQRIYFKEEAIMNTLSGRMQKEINDYCCRRMMTKINILNGLAQEVRDELLHQFTMKIFLPKDTICNARTTNRYVYFLYYGTVAVYTTSGNEGNAYGNSILLTKVGKTIIIDLASRLYPELKAWDIRRWSIMVFPTKICHLYDGSYFGTVSLLMKDRKTVVFVSALETCEVYQLDQDVFLRAVTTNPEIFEQVMETARRRLKETHAVESARRSIYDEDPFEF